MVYDKHPSAGIIRIRCAGRTLWSLSALRLPVCLLGQSYHIKGGLMKELNQDRMLKKM